MKLDTTQVLKNLNGESFKENDQEVTLGKAVASILSIAKTADPLRSFLLGGRFYNQEEVEITPEDAVYIKDLLKESTYFPIVLGQIIQELNK